MSATPADRRPEVEHPALDDLEAALRLIEADRLERFARTFDRYTRTELAEVGESVSAIPGAAASVAAHFASTDEDAARRRDLTSRAAALQAAAAAAASGLLARFRRSASAALILRRGARAHLRPVSPRSPALPPLA